jgi:hypothetical protein
LFYHLQQLEAAAADIFEEDLVEARPYENILGVARARLCVSPTAKMSPLRRRRVGTGARVHDVSLLSSLFYRSELGPGRGVFLFEELEGAPQSRMTLVVGKAAGLRADRKCSCLRYGDAG